MNSRIIWPGEGQSATSLLVIFPPPFTCPFTGQTPVPGRGVADLLQVGPTGEMEDKELGAPAAPPGMQMEMAGIRSLSKSETNAPKLQPYPLTEDGKVPV